VGSTLGHLNALDEVSGRLVWSDTLSAAIAPSDYNGGADTSRAWRLRPTFWSCRRDRR
jgi:hypothetical protein